MKLLSTVKLISTTKILFSLSLIFFSYLAQAHDSDHSPESYHLAFNGGALHAHIEWLEEPMVGSESYLLIEWKNGENHSPTDPPGSFEVALDMPSMGHGSEPTEVEPWLDETGQEVIGSYKVSNIHFFMGGLWEIQVTLSYPDGSVEMRFFEKNFPGGGHGHGNHH
mgnify:CR=1 FL=1